MSNALIQPIYSVNIAGALLNNATLDCDITVEMSTSIEPDTFKIKVFNVDPITQAFISKGSMVSITLGYNSGVVCNIISGIITSITHEIVDNEHIFVLEGIDATVNYMKKKDVHYSANTSQDVINIIKTICNSAGVSVNAIPALSGVTVENYTIENKNLYDSIKDLVKRIGYNATAKTSQLYITKTMSNAQVAANITNELDFKLTKLSGLNQNSKTKIEGYNFFGTGIPTMIPLRVVNVSMIDDSIIGNYIVETIVHKYNTKTGYTCYGNLIEPTTLVESVESYRYPTSKNLATVLSEKITKIVESKPTIDTGEVEQIFSSDRVLTSKIGVDKNKNSNIVSPSVQATIGDNNVYSIKKPLSSVFAGNGYGLIAPVYKDNRAVLGFNRFDLQDANVLGFLWKKGWVIPAHDDGEFQIHMKNHSKISMKEDGSAIIQAKSLKIQIGSTNLIVSKPSKTDDGKLLIEFDDSSELSYKAGTGWKLKTSGNVVVEGTSIKLGENATLGVARLNDPVVLDSGLLTWMNTHTHPTAATGPPSPPTISHSGTDAGTVKTASTKVKSE